MGAEVLSSRAVIGMFYEELQAAMAASWVSRVGMQFNSGQDVETYPWLGMTPAMREWVGSRQAKGFISNAIEVRNKHYEATIQFLLKDLRRDKTGQVRVRIGELAERAVTHWASLVSTLILNGGATACYDGQYFFDTDHADPGADYTTSQSNSVSVDISALPAQVHGAVTAPSVEEMAQSILNGVSTIQGFLDDRGEPVNETAKAFLVQVPTSLYQVAVNALAQPLAAGAGVQAASPDLRIEVANNPRLNTWTDKFAVFRTDGRQKSFILQEETGVTLKAKAEGSEFEFDNDAHQYGIDSWRNVAYGQWRHATLITMI
ncbi:MAG: Mu-like prophage major head subunit gpT family protein [Betaproteobacteria bacterium]|nr:Mu-like prophage major head subunit gpT family protein [Betaproteobacteria bacterium]